jgi:ribose transport system permease protein
VFLFLFIAIAAFLDEKFLTMPNFRNLIVTAFPNILAACAQTIVIIGAGIDLSVGSLVTLGNVICAATMSKSWSGALMSVVYSLSTGAAMGFISGFTIAKLRIQPLIVTLATSTIAAGLSLAILPKPGGSMHVGFASFMGGRFMGLPNAFFLCCFSIFIIWLLLNRTQFGEGLYAVGGSELSAYSCGVKIVKVKILAYTLSGLLSATAGVFLSTQMYSGDPTVGDSYTLRSVTIAALGGISLFGGKGNVTGVIAGAGILVIINNILNLSKVPTFYQFIIQGLILVGALMLTALLHRKKYSGSKIQSNSTKKAGGGI